MPTFRLQYDLRATYINNNCAGVSHGHVYNEIEEELANRNWTRHQSSNWYKTQPGFVIAAAVADVQAACAAAEALCGLPPNPVPTIFHRVEVEEQFGPTHTAR
jgi:hypothetical protein